MGRWPLDGLRLGWSNTAENSRMKVGWSIVGAPHFFQMAATQSCAWPMSFESGMTPSGWLSSRGSRLRISVVSLGKRSVAGPKSVVTEGLVKRLAAGPPAVEAVHAE